MQNLTLHDDALGVFSRASYDDADGNAVALDSFEGNFTGEGEDVALVVETANPLAVAAVLPALRSIVERRRELATLGVTAIVTDLAEQAPSDESIAEAAKDLQLDTITIAADGAFSLHFTDLCGEHFLDGYWPYAAFTSGGEVDSTGVES